VSLSLYVIHNSNRMRNDYLFPLVSKLSEVFEIKLNLISWQPVGVVCSRFFCFIRRFFYWFLDVKWSIYRGDFSLVSSFAKLITTIKVACFSFVSCVNDRRTAAIESMVSAKHIRAWESFLESGADLGLFFEDDVIFKDDSFKKLEILLGYLIVDGRVGKGLYADLAGGLDNQQLRLSHVTCDTRDGLRVFSRPVTNTACAYVCDRILIESILKKIIEKPFLRRFSIDWIMNSLFMSIDSELDVFCVHADPTIFVHGTFSGSYQSWQK